MPRLWPRPRKADFPRASDLPADIDTYAASRALSALWRLCDADVAKVYHPHMDHTTWNVWLEITARRVELVAWVREWLASQEPEGNDAA